MNKQDIAKLLAQKFDFSSATAKEVIEEVTNIIVTAVKEQGKIVWPDLGTFSSSERSAREGRNPMTGEKISIPAKTVPKFSAAKNFKDEVEDSEGGDKKAA